MMPHMRPARPSALVLVFVLVLVGCGDPKPTATATATAPAPIAAPAPGPAKAASGLPGWELPTGWRGEVIPFPLDFAPSLPHRGYEDLRFPAGFFDPASGEYWSYTFVWRTDDAATLDAAALGGELTTYFRGLIAAVDEKGKITARDRIVARATAAGDQHFELSAHVFDAFKTAQPIDLVGWADRRACKTGALWRFVLAPATTTIRAELDRVANAAGC